MKKNILLIILTIALPLQIFSFSLVGDPIAVPVQKQYVVYNKDLSDTKLPDINNADVQTTLLLTGIDTQAIRSNRMFYTKGNQIHLFENSEWAVPLSNMLTVATFEYILRSNMVSALALKNINVVHNYTLFGSTSYGPIIDADNDGFFFYITFYLKNQQTQKMSIKTFKFEKNIDSSKLNADMYAQLTNESLANIFSQMKPWVLGEMKAQEAQNKLLLAKAQNWQAVQ